MNLGPFILIPSDDGGRTPMGAAKHRERMQALELPEMYVVVPDLDTAESRIAKAAEATGGEVGLFAVQAQMALAAPLMLRALSAVDHFRQYGVNRDSVLALVCDELGMRRTAFFPEDSPVFGHVLWTAFVQKGSAGAHAWVEMMVTAAMKHAGVKMPEKRRMGQKPEAGAGEGGQG